MLLQYIFMSIFVLSFIIFFLAQIISLKENQELEKPTPFECGFITKMNIWSPFSMQFFLSALIFLVFDVELVLLFPFILGALWKISWMSMVISMIFLIALSLGFLLEWSNKFLEWAK